MRTWANKGIVAAALVGTFALGGCHRDWEYHFGPLLAAHPAQHDVRAARPVRASRAVTKKRSVVERVVAPRMVTAGARIRSFCGQRHIRFQSGALREQASEKARNDALCRQVY